MINIDDRLITDVLPKIKPNAFAVLMAISKHLGRNGSCWPNQQTLQKITGLGRDSIFAALKVLYDSNLLIKQERPGYSNIYTLNTEYISIFMPANRFSLEDTPTEIPTPPPTEIPTRSINKGSINHYNKGAELKIETNTPTEAHVTRDQRLEPKVIVNQIQTSTAPIDPGGDEWGAKTEKRSHRSSGEAVGASTPRPHSQKVTKEEREAAFRKQAETYIGKYDEEMITAFCDYWTESNPTGLKLKFELQKIFDISRRLATWDKNNINRKWKTSSAINTSPDLDNYDLPPDLLTKYNNYLESVQQNFPALLKSNCRIYSKDDFFDLSTDRTVTARRNRITDRKYQELWIQAHRDLVEKPYLRTQNATVYEYTRKLMRQELEYA